MDYLGAKFCLNCLRNPCKRILFVWWSSLSKISSLLVRAFSVELSASFSASFSSFWMASLHQKTNISYQSNLRIFQLGYGLLWPLPQRIQCSITQRSFSINLGNKIHISTIVQHRGLATRTQSFKGELMTKLRYAPQHSPYSNTLLTIAFKLIRCVNSAIKF